MNAKRSATDHAGVIDVADAMLEAFGKISYIKTITKRDRDNLESLAALIVTQLKRIPIAKEGPTG